jgi:hypothetical protein
MIKWIKKILLHPLTSSFLMAYGLKNLLHLSYDEMFSIYVIIIGAFNLICFLTGMFIHELD